MKKVALGVTLPQYNDTPPFHPDEHFPELPFLDISPRLNFPYRLLRRLFLDLGLDSEHHSSASWNPLGEYIRPRATVLIKPNFVLSYNASGDDLFAVVTHPSILRALVDYAFVALRGEGRIIIADAPQMDCDWDELMDAQRLDTVQEFYHSRFRFDLEVRDLRAFTLCDRRKEPLYGNRKPLPGDPLGSVLINLGRGSMFYGMPNDRFYGADFDRQETMNHHRDEVHEYSVSRSVLSADTLLFAPKMKVHKKVGVTLNLKGLVGINTNKNCLIHHRRGTPSEGGDQLPDGVSGRDLWVFRTRSFLQDQVLAAKTPAGERLYKAARSIYRIFLKRVIGDTSSISHTCDGGNWHGNDSAWRMTADMARIIYFADREGCIQSERQRRIFCIVDGIVGGERNGPLAPSAKRCGCMVAGDDPFAVDIVAARTMGFDFRKIKQFSVVPDLLNSRFDPLRDIHLTFQGIQLDGGTFFDPTWKASFCKFEPHPGWIGAIEI